MSDKGKIIAALAVFVVIVTFPFWYGLGAGTTKLPEMDLPKDAEHCVESKEYMLANHMTLLDHWRDWVVRDGMTTYESGTYEGAKYKMSLTETCLGCHTNREKFCSACHEYSNVQQFQPLQVTKPGDSKGRIRCWDCHIEESKGN